MATRGRCLCGAVTYEFDGPMKWRGYCHCESCRRNTSSPVAAFFGVPREAFRFTGAAPKVFNSSPGVQRLFCDRCGSPMAFQGERWPGEIHLYAASLEDPEAYCPEAHVHVDEQLSWFDIKDDLPRHRHSG